MSEPTPETIAFQRIEEAYQSGSSRLELSGLSLSELPESLGNLSQLQELNLSDNHLITLPESIGQLSQLRQLVVPRNQLGSLPESIGQLSELHELNVSNNQLVSLPESIGKLKLLWRLYAGLNRLSTLPESIGQLTLLEILDLTSNRITTLPESVGRLERLTRLYLSGNQLATLPESVGELRQLQVLVVHDNVLSSLPASIGEVERLRILDLTGNKLSILPESLRNLRSLNELYLHQNKLGLPPEVLGPEWNHPHLKLTTAGLILSQPPQTLEYYFRTRVGQRPLNEAKLILIGRGATGKTSIVNRLVHGRFERNQNKTEGIQITTWSIMIDIRDNVRLNIWDFGGQEIMHATHQFFLTQRSLYLLVLNGRGGAEDADAEYWLRIIESFSADSPVIVVLNKINEQLFDVNRRALEGKFTSIRDFIKTDCEDGTGFEQLHRAIVSETDRLEHLRDAFPESWFSIKDRLAAMPENYLTFDEYRKICSEFGERDPGTQERLAFYLHHLGIVLNYKDDPRLQDTHVLNPHWVTIGIYKVLNSEKLAARNGEIHLRDLSTILDPSQYPTAMHRFLFDLMKKFDLCFSFPSDDAYYLIPELLDKQEPEASAEFKPKECLNFQYHYPVLPEGLLPRFIVRTHVFSEGLPRWRSGVIVEREGNRALVKSDGQDKKVFISVSGAIDGRRRLLAIVRSEFERLHRDIQNLQPAEMIPLPGHPEVVVPYKELLVMEKEGMKRFPKVIRDEIVELDVRELLDGVSPPPAETMKGQPASVRLFYSYSHKDEELRDEMETHLRILHRRGLIESWHDRKIEAGDDWKQRINENLEAAHIILLLVSADFIASDYCYEKEMNRALEIHENKEARVIPIILRDCNWKDAPFVKLQCLPKAGLAVTSWMSRDSAWRNVSEEIQKVIQKLQQK